MEDDRMYSIMFHMTPLFLCSIIKLSNNGMVNLFHSIPRHPFFFRWLLSFDLTLSRVCSRERFGEVNAKTWWEENRERIQAQYLWLKSIPNKKVDVLNWRNPQFCFLEIVTYGMTPDHHGVESYTEKAGLPHHRLWSLV